MKQYAKLNDGRLKLCPRNGYVKGIAVSNLNAYFNAFPEKAKEEGYTVVVYLDKVVDNSEFEIRDNIIYEKEV